MYLFNDDKSKAEIKIEEGSVTVNAGAIKELQFTADFHNLPHHFNNMIVLAVSQGIEEEEGIIVWYPMGTIYKAGESFNLPSFVYRGGPSVLSDNYAYLRLYNPTDVAKKIYYRIIAVEKV